MHSEISTDVIEDTGTRIKIDQGADHGPPAASSICFEAVAKLLFSYPSNTGDQ